MKNNKMELYKIFFAALRENQSSLIDKTKARSKQNDILKNAIRIRVEITLHFQASRRPPGNPQGGRIASCLTDKQRRQSGWSGFIKVKLFLSEPEAAF